MTTALVFIGDSITDAGRREDPDQLGAGYVRLIASRLASPATTFVNTGIGGNRVGDLVGRWDADALAHRPDILTIYIGINDTWRRYGSEPDPTTADAFGHQLSSLLESATEAGVPHLVLMEPFVLPVTDEQERWIAEDLGEKQAVVAELARTWATAFVPLQSLMAERAAEVGAAAIADDGVHPTAAGDEIIADGWIAAAAHLVPGPGDSEPGGARAAVESAADHG